MLFNKKSKNETTEIPIVPLVLRLLLHMDLCFHVKIHLILISNRFSLQNVTCFVFSRKKKLTEKKVCFVIVLLLSKLSNFEKNQFLIIF